jgi:hypothetical protein
MKKASGTLLMSKISLRGENKAKDRKREVCIRLVINLFVFFILVFLINISFVSASQKYTLKVTEEHPFFVLSDNDKENNINDFNEETNIINVNGDINKVAGKSEVEGKKNINGIWKTAKNLQVGDFLITDNGKKAKITSVKSVDEDVEVYNLEALPFNDFIVNGNIVVHNSNQPLKFIEYQRKGVGTPESWEAAIDRMFKENDVKDLDPTNPNGNRNNILSTKSIAEETINSPNGLEKLRQMGFDANANPSTGEIELVLRFNDNPQPYQQTLVKLIFKKSESFYVLDRIGIVSLDKFSIAYANYLKEKALRQCDIAIPFRASRDGTARGEIFSNHFANLVESAYAEGRYIPELNTGKKGKSISELSAEERVELAPKIKELIEKKDFQGAEEFRTQLIEANEKIKQLDMTNFQDVVKAKEILRELYPDIAPENLQKIIDALKQNQGLRIYAKSAANAVRNGIVDDSLKITIERPEGTFVITYNGMVTIGQCGSQDVGYATEEITLSAFPSKLADFIAQKALKETGKKTIALEVGRIATKLREMNREDFFQMLAVMFTEVKRDLKIKIKEALKPEFAKKFTEKELEVQLELAAEQEFNKLNIIMVSVQNFGDSISYKAILCRIGGASKEGADSLLEPPITNNLRKDEFGRYWAQIKDSNGKVTGELQLSVNIFYWKPIAEYIKKKWSDIFLYTNERL